ncbi:hypothetical protein N7451_001709 [Penicillium sp. IBT 35674x]|nr:hypothetical protein N7451_001709 [Penicillium sp. IBT 35674x]
MSDSLPIDDSTGYTPRSTGLTPEYMSTHTPDSPPVTPFSTGTKPEYTPDSIHDAISPAIMGTLGWWIFNSNFSDDDMDLIHSRLHSTSRVETHLRNVTEDDWPEISEAFEHSRHARHMRRTIMDTSETLSLRTVRLLTGHTETGSSGCVMLELANYCQFLQWLRRIIARTVLLRHRSRISKLSSPAS